MTSTLVSNSFVQKQWNETSKYFRLKEYPFSEKILPNMSHKINKREGENWNKNVLGEQNVWKNISGLDVECMLLSCHVRV